jgi:hypothetical protein
MRAASALIASLLLLPLAAHAAGDRPCKEAQPRNLSLDFTGVDTVVFDIGGNTLDVRVSAGASGRIEGRACASDAIYLPRLTLVQQRDGGTLVVRARDEGLETGIFNSVRQVSNHIFGKHYAYMALRADVPDRLVVEIKVGSGEARLEGAREAVAEVGSGDARILRVQGPLTAKVGSGDLDVGEVGALQLRSVGSGDATIRGVRGATRVGSVGSGDLAIEGTRGPVDIGSIGSGDVALGDIGGDVSVGSIGSGDLVADGVRGDLSVRSVGSGDVDHRNVAGRVQLPSER